jgi:hypothetical protein
MEAKNMMPLIAAICLSQTLSFFWGGGWSWERFPQSRDRSPLVFGYKIERSLLMFTKHEQIPLYLITVPEAEHNLTIFLFNSTIFTLRHQHELN